LTDPYDCGPVSEEEFAEWCFEWERIKTRIICYATGAQVHTLTDEQTLKILRALLELKERIDLELSMWESPNYYLEEIKAAKRRSKEND